MALTPDLLRALNSECERTGVGAIALLKHRADKPDGLSAAKLQHWLLGRVDAVPANHVAYVLDLWRALPDNEWVEVSDELLSELQAAQRRSGVTMRILMRGRSDVPEGMNVSRAAAILSSKAMRVRRSHLEFLLRTND